MQGLCIGYKWDLFRDLENETSAFEGRIGLARALEGLDLECFFG